MVTSRHITFGGPDLIDCEWNNSVLKGKSDLVAKDSYTIYIYEPAGSIFKAFKCEGVKVTGIRKTGNIRQITIVSERSGIVIWQADYSG